MEKLCYEIGMITSRFPAVDGSSQHIMIPESLVLKKWDSALNATFDETCVSNPAIEMSLSERACAMSNVIVWQAIASMSSKQQNDNDVIIMSVIHNSLNEFTKNHFGGSDVYNTWLQSIIFSHSLNDDSRSEARYYLILEDDATISEKPSTAPFRAHIRQVIEALPHNCELCYLGYAVNWSKQVECDFADESIFFVPSYLWQLHGYLLTPAGARKLLSHLPINAPVDNFVARLVYEKKIKV